MEEKARDLWSLARIETTSRWIYEEDHKWPDDSPPDDFSARLAAEDIVDLENADLVIVFTDPRKHPPCQSGGKHVEFGYALGRGKQVMVVGPAENVFYTLLTRFDDWQSALEHLRFLPRPERPENV